jgi:hypothetical protein
MKGSVWAGSVIGILACKRASFVRGEKRGSIKERKRERERRNCFSILLKHSGYCMYHLLYQSQTVHFSNTVENGALCVETLLR